MVSISELIEKVENTLNEAIALHKRNKAYNIKLSELETAITLLSKNLSAEPQKIEFSDQDKKNIANISLLINALQNITNSKLDFYESLSTHLSGKINTENNYR